MARFGQRKRGYRRRGYVRAAGLLLSIRVLLGTCLLGGIGPFAAGGAFVAVTSVVTLQEAQAQTRVRDRRLRRRTRDENRKRVQEIIWKLQEIDEMLRQAERLAYLADRAINVRSVTEAIDLLVQYGDALGYSRADLAAVFDATFSGEGVPADVQVYLETQGERLLESYSALLAAVGAQMEQFEDAYRTLQDFKYQAIAEADNQQKALQLQAAVEIYKAEEMMLLRQALALQTNAQALIGAYRTDRDAVRRAILLKSLGLSE